jgi:purine-nucleoside phosphorylase
MSSRFDDLAKFCRNLPPQVAIVLGSGLNDVADRWPVIFSVAFTDIPDLPKTGVVGHKGQLSLHGLHGRRLLIFQGRVHFYEGHSVDAVTRPIQVARELGVRQLLLTNAAGGIGPMQIPGSLMLLQGHINCQRNSWWPNVEIVRIYSTRLQELLRVAAISAKVRLREGIYAGVTGPNYETPAEVRALRTIGADAVGMSTVHEAEAAHQWGLEVAAISCVANWAAGLSQQPLTHHDVLQQVRMAAGELHRLLEQMILQL